MASTTGIHAGFLWQIANNGAIYLNHEHGVHSPFHNPKFEEAYKKADRLAFVFFAEDVEENDVRHLVVSELAEETKNHLDDGKISVCNEKLATLIKQLPRHPLLGDFVPKKEDNARQQFVRMFVFYLFYSYTPQKKEEDTNENQLRMRARKEGKECISLESQKEATSYLAESFKHLFKAPAFYLLVHDFFLSQKDENDWNKMEKKKGRAWDFGVLSSFEKPSPLTDEKKEELETLIEKEYSTNDLEVANRLSGVIQEKLIQLNSSRAENICTKICDLLKKHPNTLIIAPAEMHKSLFIALTSKKVHIRGPITEAMKPRGFLWEIKKAGKIAGYFFGSIHIVPNWVLKNLNSKTLEAFERCDILGVELDITREGVAEQFEKKIKVPEAKKERFIEVIKEGLKDNQITLDDSNRDAFIQKGFDLLIKAICKKSGAESGLDLFFH